MIVPVANVAAYLDTHHYLGRARRGIAWSDDIPVVEMVCCRHAETSP